MDWGDRRPASRGRKARVTGFLLLGGLGSKAWYVQISVGSVGDSPCFGFLFGVWRKIELSQEHFST